MVEARDWGKGGGGNRELMVKGGRVSVLQDEKLLEMDGGHGCTTVWIYLMPLNCTLRNTVCYVYFTTMKKNWGKKEKGQKGKDRKQWQISRIITSRGSQNPHA